VTPATFHTQKKPGKPITAPHTRYSRENERLRRSGYASSTRHGVEELSGWRT